MSHRTLDREKRETEGVSSDRSGIRERRQQLAQQIGRLLARIWLQRHSENQVNNSITESMPDPSSVSL
ncbi:MAG: hypothetical protein U0941_25960 [Planctomycetaceae bacterium]